MKHLRLTTIALFALLTLGACSKSEDPGRQAGGTSSNELLSYVPAEAPYVLANLEPVPDDVIDTFLTRLQPVMDTMQSQLTGAREELESNPNHSDEPGARFAHALLMEFDGKLSRAGLESMGLDLQARRVVYGMGAFPVIRLGLSDAQALRETFLRVLNNAGITAPEQEFQGVSYWRLADDNHGDVPVGMYVSILEKHLAVSVFPTQVEAEFLPAFLGLELPANSDAQVRLEKLNQANGYTGYGSGILDLRKLADQFLSADTVMGRLMAGSGEFDPATLPAECVAEIRGIIANTPVMTLGVKELNESALAVQYRVETPGSLASQLMGLVSTIPAASHSTDRVLELAFGMRFGAVRDFVREKATAIVNSPYRCEHLLEMNDSAALTLEKLNQPMPPFLNNFRGIRVSLSEIMMSPDSIPENARGHLAVHVEQPQMFVGMAQMFLPDLSELAIAPGEPPVRLPQNLLPVPGLVAYAAMSEDAIGLAMGEGEDAGLPGFLDREAGPEGMFLSASYDMSAYLEHSSKLEDHYQEMDGGEDNAYLRHAQAATEIREAASRAFRDMVDRSQTSLRFTAEGLAIDNRVTFK